MNIGQLFITGISGLTLSTDEKILIKNNDVGGIIFFSHNYHDPAQLSELINSIKSLKNELPFFFSVDQEGGRVQRFKTHFTHFPSMYSIAQKTNSPKRVYEAHSIMAAELAACGINLSFSPCADIWTNDKNTVIGDRSFGHDAPTVEKFVSAAIRGLHQNNVLACVKHFPGHGMTTKDSHIDLPIVKKTLADLNTHEFIPFRKAIKNQIEFIMMAHLLVDSIDSNLPTSLSPHAYNILRNELGYKNIIISDDMEMKAIADRYGYGDAAYKALTAGCDIMLYRSTDSFKTAIEYVKDMAGKNQDFAKQLEAKIERVVQVKKKWLNPDQLIDIPNISDQFSRSEHYEYLEELKTHLI